jgi:hypothetical protein
MAFSIVKNLMTNFQLSLVLGFIFAMSGNNIAKADIFLPKGCSIVTSTKEILILKFQPELKGFDTLRLTNGNLTILPRINGAFAVAKQSGGPLQLQYSIPITVPNAQAFQLYASKAQSVSRIKGMITPKPYMQLDGDNPAIPIYEIDEHLYQEQNHSAWSSLEYQGIARNRHLAQLSVIIAKYDNQSGTIDIPKNIIVEIRFTPNGPSISTVKEEYDPEISINHHETKDWILASSTAFSKNISKVQETVKSKWLKMIVSSQGIYKVDAASLSSAGLSIKPEEIPTIKVYGNGAKLLSENVDSALSNTMNEQKIIVKTKANGELDAIYFYGEGPSGFTFKNGDYRHFTHPFSKENVYLITAGGSIGLRAEALPSLKDDQVISKPTQFNSRIFTEDELYNALAAPSGRTWYGKSVESTVPLNYSTILHGLSRSGEITYRYCVSHKSTKTGYFSISENNKVFDSIYVLGTNPYDSYYNYVESISSCEQSFTIPANTISNDNRSILKFSYRNPSAGATSSGFVDWFEILYPREFTATSNQLEIFSDSTINGGIEYSINQFSGNEIFGFDITDDKNPELLQNISVTGGLYIFRAMQKNNQAKRYFVASEFKNPKLIVTDFANLRQNISGASMLLITHADLMESAEKYKKFKESTSKISVKIATTEQIYNEFSSGITDITAIRDYVSYALNYWTNKPQYLLLWGDGHYDYRGIQLAATNYVPTYQTDQECGSFNATITSCIDDYFARTIGNDAKVDISAGRIPVLSPVNGLELVDKLQHYEENSDPGQWQTTVCLVADDGPVGVGSDGTQHTQQSENLASTVIPSDMQLKKIYLAEYPVENVPNGRRKPAVTQQLLTDINTTGAVLLNWIGHGSPRLWAHERVFEKETTIPQMINKDRLFYLTAATCDFARFDDAERESGAEELLRSTRGGAIGVFAATRPVFSYQNADICEMYYKFLFTKDANGDYLSIGDALYRTKQYLYDDNAEKYLILGDPSMHLKIPNLDVQVLSINNSDIPQSTPLPADSLLPKVKALQKVEIQGEIIKSIDKTKLNSFNGRILLTMKEHDIQLKAFDPKDNATHEILENGGVLNRSSYPVKDGSFTASFVIPKDISFSNKKGKLFSYAYDSEQGISAKGCSQAFIVGGIEQSDDIDKSGPSIQVYMDDRTFQPGNLIRKSPLLIVDLFDETGINSTGAGIGHKIEAWFNTSYIPVDLTDGFETEITDSRKGTTQKRILNLPVKTTSVRVRAWDVWNNYSEAETYFRLADNDSNMITEGLSIYPNPMINSTSIRFNHNQTLPTFAEIRIFAANGALIKSDKVTQNELHSWIYEWDGKDNDGNAVSSGLYICSVIAYSANGSSMRMTDEILKIR